MVDTEETVAPEGSRPPLRFGHLLFDYTRSQLAPKTMLRINYFNFFWVFVVGAFLGIVVEAGFHIIAYGQFENRAGLVWGPFSPLYGIGAIILTLSMDRLYKAHNLFVFLISALEGAAIEFFASLLLQYSWGAIAWDYTGTIGSVGGRTNLLFAFMWGLVGLFWVRLIMPLITKGLAHFDLKRASVKVVTAAFTLFLAADLCITWMALYRQEERVSEIPPQNGLDEVLDECFPDEFMDARFHNLSVLENSAAAQPSEDSYAAQRRNAEKAA